MGLDISVYRKLKKVPDSEGMDQRYPEDREPLEGYTKLYINPDFPGRADEFDGGSFYSFEEEGGGFRAGSYGGYNHWREQLASLVGFTPKESWDEPEAHKHKPFYELVCFSDCEGTLGTSVCAKLAKDFAAFQDKADAFDDGPLGYFHKKYADWREAFEMGADGGAVALH